MIGLPLELQRALITRPLKLTTVEVFEFALPMNENVRVAAPVAITRADPAAGTASAIVDAIRTVLAEMRMVRLTCAPLLVIGGDGNSDDVRRAGVQAARARVRRGRAPMTSAGLAAQPVAPRGATPHDGILSGCRRRRGLELSSRRNDPLRQPSRPHWGCRVRRSCWASAGRSRRRFRPPSLAYRRSRRSLTPSFCIAP